MRRLWVQLSVAFSTVVVVSAALVIIVTVIYGESQREAVENRVRVSVAQHIIYGESGVVALMQARLNAGGGLDEAAELLAAFASTQLPQPYSVAFQFSAADGSVLYGDAPADSEQVAVGDGLLRYAITLSPSPSPDEISRTPPPETSLLLLSGTGVVVGIGISLAISRRLAAPLSRLAEVARQVGGRDFAARVTPSGTDEMRQVANAVNNMAALLQAAERLRANLVADVAHELRTPLTVMEGSLRALIDDVYPLTKAEVLSLYDQTRHLSRLVNDLHELSLAEAHALALERRPFDLSDLLRSAGDIFRPVAEAEVLSFVSVIPDTPTLIVGDAGRLRQVIQNLLINALRHTPAGGEIRLSLVVTNGAAHITLADTGSGVAGEHLAHIFERFYRADRARARDRGGAGLGLAIGKAIIEAHGGEITVTSRTTPPTGTQFMITLSVMTDERI